MKKERRDATRIMEVDGLHSLMTHIFPKRTECEVSLTENFDVTELMEYIRERNAERETLISAGGAEAAEAENMLPGKLTFFHAFCTAIARTVYLRPKMNIFISGRHYWQRKDISLSFIAKRQFADGAEESLMWLKVDPEWTIDDMARRIIGDVKATRESSPAGMDHTLDVVGKMPRFVIRLIVGFMNLMEYWGMAPESLTRGDTNYSSVLLSNLGSIGAPSVYHHLNNYGTNSVMITIGTIHKELKLQRDGSVKEREIVDATFIIDERIADGFYFAKSLRITKYLLEHPEALKQQINQPVPVEL